MQNSGSLLSVIPVITPPFRTGLLILTTVIRVFSKTSVFGKATLDLKEGAVREVLTTKAQKAHEGNIDAKSNLYCPFVRLFRLRGKKFLLIGHLLLKPFPKLTEFWKRLIILSISCLFSGCYTVTQGVTMLGYLNRAIPLEQVDDEEFVRLVTDIRIFAMKELGLAESRNYTRYVELDRNYLAAVVSASARDSFRRHEWWFPIVGRMPYKGFFNIDGARRERKRLERKDLDVWVRGVDAFSTLGWFRDPLFSYMRDYSTWRLADLIIHELVHSTVFIKGQMNFNEELAQFIGNEGARLFMETRYGIDSEEYQKMLAADEDSRNFVAFIQELIAELDVLYAQAANGKSRDDILIEKELIINAAKERFEAEYESRFSGDNFRGFSELPVNNAYLELFRLYHTDDNFYEDLFEHSGRSLPAFIAAAKTITKNGGDPRIQLKNALLISRVF